MQLELFAIYGPYGGSTCDVFCRIWTGEAVCLERRLLHSDQKKRFSYAYQPGEIRSTRRVPAHDVGVGGSFG